MSVVWSANASRPVGVAEPILSGPVLSLFPRATCHLQGIYHYHLHAPLVIRMTFTCLHVYMCKCLNHIDLLEVETVFPVLILVQQPQCYLSVLLVSASISHRMTMDKKYLEPLPLHV